MPAGRQDRDRPVSAPDRQELNVALEHGVAILTLAVPEKRNALTLGLRTAMRDALSRLDKDAGCRAIVLTGAGDAFSSGGDIAQMRSDDPGGSRERLAILHDVIRLVAAGSKPVVSAVRGPAYGGGFALAIAADAVVADETASFCAPFVKIGLMPDMGLLWSLPQRVGAPLARRIVMDARVIEAREAHRIGIVDEVVPEGAHVERARAIAGELSRHLPLPIGHAKGVLASQPGDLDAVLAAELDAQPRLMASADHRGAREAFLSRRDRAASAPPI